MLYGVAVDELTGHFLQIATDRGKSGELARTLREFFHDASNRLNSLKIGLYIGRRDASPAQGAVWEELDQSYRGLEQLIDRLQTICRPLELTPVRGDLGEWLEDAQGVLVVARRRAEGPPRVAAAAEPGRRLVRPEVVDPGPRRAGRLALGRGGTRRARGLGSGRRRLALPPGMVRARTAGRRAAGSARGAIGLDDPSAPGADRHGALGLDGRLEARRAGGPADLAARSRRAHRGVGCRFAPGSVPPHVQEVLRLREVARWVIAEWYNSRVGASGEPTAMEARHWRRLTGIGSSAAESFVSSSRPTPNTSAS